MYKSFILIYIKVHFTFLNVYENLILYTQVSYFFYFFGVEAYKENQSVQPGASL